MLVQPARPPEHLIDDQVVASPQQEEPSQRDVERGHREQGITQHRAGPGWTNGHAGTPRRDRNPIALWEIMERAKRFELSTPTLARLCSTPELRPRSYSSADARDRRRRHHTDRAAICKAAAGVSPLRRAMPRVNG